MTPRLHLFGTPTLERGGDRLALPFERRGQLLAYLALKRGWVERAELAALLWPEQGNKLAYTNLRKTLFRLQALSWAPPIESQGGLLRLDIDTDVLAFDSALHDQRIADALLLRRGELLAGFDDDGSEAWTSWLGFERDRLRVAWRAAALARLACDDLDPADGVTLSAQLLEADPLDEAALRAQMAWLACSGQGARAQQVYREFVARLKQELGIAPGAELKALHDSLVADAAPSGARPAAAPDDGFIGRTVELQRIVSWLGNDDCRLLCVTGPGGMGKTRLARRALRDLAPDFIDGAVFVPLEDVAGIGALGERLARELGVDPRAGQPALDAVIEFLRERRMLLVLDNFEQLAAGAAVLERLLCALPGIKLLVTSRVRLALAAERLMPLEGLPCPDPEDLDCIDAFDAVRLFVRAAQRVDPAFLSALQADAVADICRLVGGLPLALELSAAWTRVLSCDAIADELRHGTELLGAVDASQPARHASFEMVFDQSWRLLTPAERDALARLSVFRGGFSADAARAVAGASLPVLGALTDKSLLRKDGDRLALHALVQPLAAARLTDDAVRQAAQRAHALHFHRLMAQLHRPVAEGERDALRRLNAEFDNCRAAWHSAAEQGLGDALRHSTPTLLALCDHSVRYEEGLSWLRAAHAAPMAQADRSLAALLLAAAAHFEYRLDRFAQAHATAERALAATEPGAHDRDARVQCLKTLGGCCLRLGRYDDARRHLRQALQQAPAHVDPHTAAAMLDNLALVEKAVGRYDAAKRLSMRSLAQHQRLGHFAGAALCLNNLATLNLFCAEYDAAAAHLREGLAICERHGIAGTRNMILANLTELAMKTGDDAAARRHATQALELAQTAGNRTLMAWLQLQFVALALRGGDLPAARRALAAALALARAFARPAMQLAGVATFASVLAAQGEADCAREVLHYVAEHPQASPIERDDFRAQLKALPARVLDADRPWPGLALDELTHRIVAEVDVAHAPLIATLRSAAAR